MSQIKDLKTLETRIEKIITNWSFEMNREDATKINLLILEEIKIDYFSAKTAIKYLVKIEKKGPDRVFLIPFDHKTINKIYQGLIDYKVPWNVMIQKEMIVLHLPLITTEKKHQIIKKWKESSEKCRVQIRYVRHQILNYWKNDLKLNNEQIREKQKQMQKIIDLNNQKLLQILETKKNHLLKV